MKKLLHFIALLIILTLVLTASARGQSVILSEDFSGFTSGSHTTPSTSDASANLDSKMSTPGWSGSLIYPAGGEVKIGTTSTTGWLETPVLDLSSSGGTFTIRFDIARWPGDATTVQVYYNESEKGSVISPTDNFQTITLNCTGEATSGKVKIRGLTKRFFLDNFVITANGMSTQVFHFTESENKVAIYPVPSSSAITLVGINDYEYIDIIDIRGKPVGHIQPTGEQYLNADISYLEPGVYYVRCIKGKKSVILRFIKTGK